MRDDNRGNSGAIVSVGDINGNGNVIGCSCNPPNSKRGDNRGNSGACISLGHIDRDNLVVIDGEAFARI